MIVVCRKLVAFYKDLDKSPNLIENLSAVCLDLEDEIGGKNQKPVALKQKDDVNGK
jgi:hypothetical protein